MRILLAPDKFKSCLTAPDVAAALADGIRRILPRASLDLCPVADGGEGTVAALAAATNGTLRTVTVTGPLPHTTVDATYALIHADADPNAAPDYPSPLPHSPSPHPPTAVLEMSSAAGLALLPPDQRNPLNTTTYGVGQLLRHAIDQGAKKIILGIGGSATNDGGVGCAQAAGARVWIDTNPRSRSRFNIEEALPVELSEPFTGRDLATLHSILPPTLPPDVQIVVACDVTNPLHGPNGAAHVYAPQKGASPDVVEQLDQGLQRLAIRSRKPHLATTPGAGAAGGLGFGLLAFFNATLQPGIDIVLDAVRLRDRLQGAALCITGEGRLDAQSLSGKTPVGVARLCRDANVPCVAVAGSIDVPDDQLSQAGITRAYPLAPPDVPLETRIQNAREYLTRTGETIARDWSSRLT